MNKFVAAFFFLITFSATVFASTYYPTDYKADFRSGNSKDEVLKDKIFTLLTSKHMYKSGIDDILSNGCNGSGKCYGHKSIGYRGARKVLFGKIHLEQDSDGAYFVKDVYCRKKITRNVTHVGPNVIPNNNVINCEHTWPQSRFSRTFEKGLQKSDLHHLYPTDSKANGTRGNNEFADVNGDRVRNCEGSHIGVEKYQGLKFEPPTEHKGNVARALFYFSVRYKLKISRMEEEYLRRWHAQDPVDAQELKRNEIIHKVQGNRNPFIDFPALVGQISNF
jgi:deoxyribonuclease-1